MAELAAGAVSSLLGVIRNEALLLDRVHGDVQFIKEEMESINSFLAHLTRTAPPDGEHDEQVRTWMKQVRELALDCSTCIDLYLQRGNPAIHRAKGGFLWRYVWWAPWFVKKLIAQHNAAIQLSKLKDRARDVGERRQRYGVEVPTKVAASPGHGHGSEAPSSHAAHAAAAAAAAQDEEDEDGHHHAPMVTVHDPDRRRTLEPRTLEDYCHEKLHKWLEKFKTEESIVPFIAIEAPGREGAAAIANAVASYERVDAGFNPAVWINLSELHSEFDLSLEPWELLFYILWVLKLKSQSQSSSPQQGIDQRKQGEKEGTGQHKQEEDSDTDVDEDDLQSQVYDKKWNVFWEIWICYKMEVNERIEKVKMKIQNIKTTVEEIQESLKSKDSMNTVDLSIVPKKPLSILFLGLLPPMPKNVQERMIWARDAVRTLQLDDDAKLIKKTAKKLKDRIEEGKGIKIHLDKKKYVNILSEVFQTSTHPLQAHEQDKSATKSTTTTAAARLGEEEIEEIVHKILVQREQGSQSEKHLEADATEEIQKKIEDIQGKIEGQLVIQGIMDKIIEHVGTDKRTLIIIQDDRSLLSSWEETRNALSQFIGAMVMIIMKKSRVAKEFCYPPWEPITCSLVGLYHDSVLQLTSQQAKENNSHNSQIFRDILDKCDPDEFCMKMFAHALYAKPNRSSYELHKLLNRLVSQKSAGGNDTEANTGRSNDTTPLVPQQLLRNNAKKIFKFSYHDLPREYKSCLLYLAIFPQGHSIRRSTLEGRWIVEGLITKEDWPTAVHHSERCFHGLMDRWLVYPDDVSAAGKVKSCMVGDRVHEFITKTAKKQHIVETRLSHHLAHRFSIFSNLRLRGSENIENFVHNLQKFALYLRLLKVLDLEGCQCFDKKNDYLKDICNKILLLKYLSLKRTNVAHLPTAINNLHELEVLDIRQTKVPEIDTKYILILKLKRLLAGQVYSSPSSSSTGMALTSNARVPHKIDKMENMEVLSNVNVSRYGDELIDIGRLYQLRKLGVVIDDNEVDLMNLLQTISDLNESLQSLSITLNGTRSLATPSSDMPSGLECSKLESLSINGVTHRVKLLPLLAKGSNNLVKVTLSKTSLKQTDLKEITMLLPNLCCFRLRHEAYTDKQITFKEQDFPELKYLIMEDTDMARITFEQGATRKLEKIVLSFTSIEYLDGITDLPNLLELELTGNECRQLKSFACAPHLSKVTLRRALLDVSKLAILAGLPCLRILMLVHQCSIGSRLNFYKGEFNKLNTLVVECSDVTSISFANGAAPKLEKIVWSFTTKVESLSGINYILQLNEVELDGDNVADQVIQDIKGHKNKPVFRHRKKPQDQPKKQVRHRKKRKGLYYLASLISTTTGAAWLAT